MLLFNTQPLPNAAPPTPTLWGLSPQQLHDRFWAAMGVQVVRQGDPADLSSSARLFLLMEPSALAILQPAGVDGVMDASGNDLIYLRIHDARSTGRRERVVTDDRGRFVRFERMYDRARGRVARAAFTPNSAVARSWQTFPSPRGAWQVLRRSIGRARRSTVSCTGTLFDGFEQAELAAFVKALTGAWRRPDLTVGRACEFGEGVWGDENAVINPSAKLIGPVWVGTGRSADAATMVLGPAVLWDDPAARPDPGPILWKKSRREDAWHETPQAAKPARPRSFTKRAFDIIFSLFAIAFTLPFYVPIALAILIEDGWPIFFLHRRETVGGREFPCLKFRSMRRGSDQLKRELASQNQCDGPQFFMDHDPRLTVVGQFLRHYRLDELPQFFNVLAGHMSVVGPRPSPFRENQFCPPWREARLSVRPGITGLWQVHRTRAPGADFQEWIKYDIEYVETAHWWLDLLIIWKTLRAVLRGGDARCDHINMP